MTALLANLPAGLTDEERHVAIHMWQRGRSHLVFSITLKVAFWEEPPWLIVASAHADEDVARRALESCLRAVCAHPIIQRLQEEPLRSQALAFVAGGQGRFEGPELARLISQLRFIPVRERGQEGPHSVVAGQTSHAPNVAMPYLSFGARRPELTPLLKNPAMFTEFADHLNTMRTFRSIVKKLQLDSHPSCRRSKHNRDPILWKVVYHADLFQQYEWAQLTSDAPLPPAPPPRQALLRAPPLRDMLEAVADIGAPSALCLGPSTAIVPFVAGDSDVGGAASGPCHKAMHKAALAFAMAQFSDMRADSEDILFGLRTGAACMHSLRSALLGHDVAFDSVDASGVARWMVFKVVALRPSKTKMPKKNTLRNTELGIELQRIHAIDVASRQLTASLEPIQHQEVLASGSTLPLSSVVIDLSALPYMDLLRLVKLDVEKATTFHIDVSGIVDDDQKPLAQRLVDRLVEGGGEYVVDMTSDDREEQVPVAECLERSGLVALNAFGHALRMELTQVARSRARPVIRVGGNAQKLLCVRDLDFMDLSVWELLEALRAAGWTCRAARGIRSLKVAGCATTHTPGAPLVFYVHEDKASFEPLYLVALLKSASQHLIVPHFGEAREYATLLGIEGAVARKRRARRALAYAPDDLTASPVQTRRKRQRAIGDSAAPLALHDGAVEGSSSESPPLGTSRSASAGPSSRASSSTPSSSSSSSSSDSQSSGRSEPGRRRRNMLNSTKFGDSWLTIRPQGIQATCRVPWHRSCNKTRNFHIAGGRELCERSLKLWLLWGPGCIDKGEHKRAFDEAGFSSSVAMQSMEELDALSFTLVDLGPCVASGVDDDSPLGPALPGVPADVHERMNKMLCEGGVPLTTPAMRPRAIFAGGTRIYVPENSMEALKSGYLRQNVPAPPGKYWAARKGGWHLALRGG